MGTLESLMSQFLTASPEDQAAFLRVARATNKKDGKEQKDSGSAERMLYESLARAFMHSTGTRIPEYGYVCKGTNAKTLLSTAIRWMKHGEGKGLKRPAELSLYSVAAGAVVEMHRGMLPPRPSKDIMLNVLTLLPAAIDASYPGYRNNGLLLWLARNVAAGKLSLKERDDDD